MDSPYDIGAGDGCPRAVRPAASADAIVVARKCVQMSIVRVVCCGTASHGWICECSAFIRVLPKAVGIERPLQGEEVFVVEKVFFGDGEYCSIEGRANLEAKQRQSSGDPTAIVLVTFGDKRVLPPFLR